MKTKRTIFLLKLAVFLLPLFLAFFVVEWRLSGVESPFVKMRNGIEQNASTIEILVCGTSHSQSGLIPTVFSRPMGKLALPLQSMVNGTQLVTKYLGSLPRLKLVLIEIWYSSFALSNDFKDTSVNNFLYFRTFGTRGDGSLLGFLDIRYFSLFFTYGRETAIQMLGKRSAEKQVIDKKFIGYTPRQSTQILTPDQLKKEVAYHEAMFTSGERPENIEALRKTLAELKARGVKAVLFMPPAIRAYTALLNPRRLHEVENLATSLAEKEGFPFVNYLRDPRFEESDFYDPDHLTEGGGGKLSTLLNDDFVVPLGGRESGTHGVAAGEY